MSNLITFIKSHPLPAFLTPVLVIGWAIQFTARAAQEGGDKNTWAALLALFTFLPGTVAVILVLVFHDHGEISGFWRRLLTWRLGLRWYLLSLMIGIGSWLAGAEIVRAAGLPVNFSATSLKAAPILFLTAFVEEAGWRGFALPYFLSRYSAVRSGLLLGIIWSLWHTPDYLRQPSGLYAALFGTLVVILTAQSIIMAGLYQRAGGVILSAVLLHWSSNVMGGMFYDGDYSAGAITGFFEIRAAVALALVIALGIFWVVDRRRRLYTRLDQDRHGGATAFHEAV